MTGITIHLNSGSSLTFETYTENTKKLLTDYAQFLIGKNQDVNHYETSTPSGLILINFNSVEAIITED
jgi:uncharacterized protein (DUF1330 family)